MLIVCGVVALLSSLHQAGTFRDMQARVTDWLFFVPKARDPELSRFVVLVGMDDKSVVELRRHGRVFNWPRSVYADVVRQLTEARARTIVFDVLFDAEGEGDEDLVQAIADAQQRAVSVVMPVAGDFLSRRETTGWERYDELFEPLPVFKDVGVGFGMANQVPDADGTVRRVPLVFDVGGEAYPSIPLLAVSKFLRRPAPWDGPIQGGRVPLAGREIPLDGRGYLTVDFRGGPHKSAPPAFPVVSFVDVQNGRVPPDTFRSKLVVIGLTATGFADDYWTPPSLRGKMDGVEIHANAMDTILSSDSRNFLHEPAPWMTRGLIAYFALLAGVTLIFLPPIIAALACGISFFIYIFAASYYFDHGGLMLNLVYPPASLGLAFAGIVIYRVIVEQAQARAMRGVLSQYLSPTVMEEVTRDPDSLKLGGEQREMTVLFTDLRDFTTISESLDPEALVHLMTDYLTAMSEVIFRHEGTIDKYMGDAIMAFWNAPQRQEDHAARAIRSARAMVDELARLNQSWATEGRPVLFMRIGVNTGVMKVGNVGSISRFDYTVMGDAVNLGARLEALNKQYGTQLIVAESTLRAAGDEFRSRFLDLVAVKGKTEPAAVYEVLTSDVALGDETDAALAAYDEGILAYRARDWLRAAARFQEALRLAPADGPSALYLERCEALMRDPPPVDWDGVFVMTHK